VLEQLSSFYFDQDMVERGTRPELRREVLPLEGEELASELRYQVGIHDESKNDHSGSGRPVADRWLYTAGFVEIEDMHSGKGSRTAAGIAIPHLICG